MVISAHFALNQRPPKKHNLKGPDLFLKNIYNFQILNFILSLLRKEAIKNYATFFFLFLDDLSGEMGQHSQFNPRCTPLSHFEIFLCVINTIQHCDQNETMDCILYPVT